MEWDTAVQIGLQMAGMGDTPGYVAPTVVAPQPAVDAAHSTVMRTVATALFSGAAFAISTSTGEHIAQLLMDKIQRREMDEDQLRALATERAAKLIPVAITSKREHDLVGDELDYSVQRGERIPDAYAIEMARTRLNLLKLAESLENICSVAEADYKNIPIGTQYFADAAKSAIGGSHFGLMSTELKNRASQLRAYAHSGPVSSSASDHMHWLAQSSSDLSEIRYKVDYLLGEHKKLKGAIGDDVRQALEKWEAAELENSDSPFPAILWKDMNEQDNATTAVRLSKTQAILQSPECKATLEHAVTVGVIKAADVAGLQAGKIRTVRINQGATPLFDLEAEEQCTKVTMALLASGCYKKYGRSIGKANGHADTKKIAPAFTYCDFNGQYPKFVQLFREEVMTRATNTSAVMTDFIHKLLTGKELPTPPERHKPDPPYYVQVVGTPKRRPPPPPQITHVAGSPGGPGDPDDGGSSTGVGQLRRPDFNPWLNATVGAASLFANGQISNHTQQRLDQAFANAGNGTGNATFFENAGFMKSQFDDLVNQCLAEGSLRAHSVYDMLTSYLGDTLTSMSCQVIAFAVTWFFTRWAMRRVVRSVCTRLGVEVPSSTTDSDTAKVMYLLSDVIPCQVTRLVMVFIFGAGASSIMSHLSMLLMAVPMLQLLQALLFSTDGGAAASVASAAATAASDGSPPNKGGPTFNNNGGGIAINTVLTLNVHPGISREDADKLIRSSIQYADEIQRQISAKAKATGRRSLGLAPASTKDSDSPRPTFALLEASATSSTGSIVCETKFEAHEPHTARFDIESASALPLLLAMAAAV